MELFFGTPGHPGPLQFHPGDGNLMNVARAVAILLLSPIWGIGAIWAFQIDEVRAGGPFHFFGDH
jgi:hypothetical protein